MKKRPELGSRGSTRGRYGEHQTAASTRESRVQDERNHVGGKQVNGEERSQQQGSPREGPGTRAQKKRRRRSTKSQWEAASKSTTREGDSPGARKCHGGGEQVDDVGGRVHQLKKTTTTREGEGPGARKSHKSRVGGKRVDDEGGRVHQLKSGDDEGGGGSGSTKMPREVGEPQKNAVRRRRGRDEAKKTPRKRCTSTREEGRTREPKKTAAAATARTREGLGGQKKPRWRLTDERRAREGSSAKKKKPRWRLGRRREVAASRPWSSSASGAQRRGEKGEGGNGHEGGRERARWGEGKKEGGGKRSRHGYMARAQGPCARVSVPVAVRELGSGCRDRFRSGCRFRCRGRLSARCRCRWVWTQPGRSAHLCQLSLPRPNREYLRSVISESSGILAEIENGAMPEMGKP
ncbi:hypothetical protein BDN72DRAFT_865394 [Pluteus cervinus]|uniref:Uncharacterized protein n=1 Tax=Pluteus cervinus TaxID=181527 RepID=A0ACD3A0B9_9AGAR|nr:hypothetical protein BDN72DRAFT_865394 [Pluteus cervinus]